MPRSRSTGSRVIRPRATRAPTAVRITETAGSSTKSWDAAVADALRSAEEQAADPIAVEVVRLWADVGARRRLATYRAAVKIAYREPLVGAVTRPASRAPRRPGSS